LGRRSLRLGRRGLRRRSLWLRLRGRLRLLGLPRGLGADRLDLDLGEAAPEAGMAPVPGSAAVLADPDLVAEPMADDERGDRRRRGEVGAAVAPDEQDLRREGLALVGLEAVDEQPLALADAVLLAADGDDRVAHVQEETRA